MKYFMQIERISLISFVLFLSHVRFSFCQQNVGCDVKPGQSQTGEKLLKLRNVMVQNGLDAYIIVSEDEHQSEYVQLYDERRAWITGFTGSAGTAAVTATKAALWTDGRYWTQAEGQLDCENWILMRQSLSGVPTLSSWLGTEIGNRLPQSRVGVATQFVSSSWWSSVSSNLNASNATLINTKELIDEIWKVPERPPAATNPVKVHDVIYAGQSWQDKVQNIRIMMAEKNANACLITALDEVAWLFNLRGSDIPYNPFFKSYALLFNNGDIRLWMNESQLTVNAKNQLSSVEISAYENFLIDLPSIVRRTSINTIWFSPDASQAIFSSIPEEKQYIAISPVEMTKAVKNSVEEKGFRDCGVRDGVARVKHLVWLEDQLNRNQLINETQSADELEKFQSQEELFEMLSFDTISAFGPNAAIIHYSPEAKTAARITKNGLYLLDAGAQYLDCTTDVTRTHVFGQANDTQKKAYTLVLQGSIDLANATFPVGTYSRQIEFLARQSLYKNFMDYNHGTGHGIGHFLSVHEGPASISAGYSPNSPPLTPGMVFSDEPGFYLPNNFGIRLETDIIVKPYKLPVNYANTTTEFLHFEVLTLVPFERDLIVCSMLTQDQKNWLNDYHTEVRNKLTATGRLNKTELNYLNKKTAPIKC